MDIFDEIFYRDGSLRDIYVCATTVEDWQKVLTFLRAGKYKVTYEIDSIETSLPNDFSQIQKHMGKLGQLLSIYVDSVRLNCHFLWVEEIEFDLLPNEVDTKEKAKTVFEFMAEIGQIIEKEVILTPENGQEHVIVRYDSKTHSMKFNDRSSGWSQLTTHWK